MLFNDSHGFLRFFHTVFNTKTFLSQRDHSHTVRVANAQLKKNAGPISQNSSFMLFKAVKIINSTPSKFPEVLNKRFKRISSKSLDMEFSKMSQTVLQKGALRAINYGSGLKRKRQQNIGALFKNGTGQDEQHAVQ